MDGKKVNIKINSTEKKEKIDLRKRLDVNNILKKKFLKLKKKRFLI